MSYQTYTTRALVCGSYDNNTADKSFLLFTRQGGMLYATARSVREERSRQRYSLQVFSMVNISLVKGKQVWRIGSVESLGNLFTSASNRQDRGSVVSIIKLLRQYIQGEEVNPLLYDTAIASLLFINGQSPKIKTEVWELFIKTKLLYQLGYIAPIPSVAKLFTLPIEDISETSLVTLQVTFLNLIATAKQVSHLTQA